MAHLLMIESGLLSSGLLLPSAIRKLGHHYTLFCREPSRYQNFPLTQGAHPAAALAECVEVCDTNDIDVLLERAVQLHWQYPFGGVLTTCDHHLWHAARVAEQLGLPSSSPAAVRVANTNSMMREAMQRAGLPGSEFALTHSIEQAQAFARNVGYPLIVKPNDLGGGILLRKVFNEKELAQAFYAIAGCTINLRGRLRVRPVLLETVVAGAEYSVESVTVAGKTAVIGVTEKSLCGGPYFVESGHMFPAKLDAEAVAEATSCARGALKSVGYDHGIAHTKIKVTEQGPHVVEINTRAGENWISELIRRVNGIDLIEITVKLALGETVDLKAVSGVKSAAVQFVLPVQAGVLAGVEGWGRIEQNLNVVDYALRPDIEGKHVYPPKSGDDYLGYVMCVDESGFSAQRMAGELVAGLRLRYMEKRDALVTP
jgi:argininosuccinate lyase